MEKIRDISVIAAMIILSLFLLPSETIAVAVADSSLTLEITENLMCYEGGHATAYYAMDYAGVWLRKYGYEEGWNRSVGSTSCDVMTPPDILSLAADSNAIYDQPLLAGSFAQGAFSAEQIPLDSDTNPGFYRIGTSNHVEAKITNNSYSQTYVEYWPNIFMRFYRTEPFSFTFSVNGFVANNSVEDRDFYVRPVNFQWDAWIWILYYDADDNLLKADYVFAERFENWLYEGEISPISYPNRIITVDSSDGAAKYYAFISLAVKSLPVEHLLHPVPPDTENAAPIARCKDVTLSANSVCVAEASIDNGSYDPDGDPTSLTQSPSGPYPKGNTNVTLTVTDSKGASSQCTGNVTVTDNTAPTINSISVDPATLWYPNHKMVPIAITASATDNCDTATCKITSVTSNEPVNGLGDADTAPDWQITGDLSVNLRAERAGKGAGRVYTLTIGCCDTSSNSSTKTATVMVPKE